MPGDWLLFSGLQGAGGVDLSQQGVKVSYTVLIEQYRGSNGLLTSDAKQVIFVTAIY